MTTRISQPSSKRTPRYVWLAAGALSFAMTFGFLGARPRGGNLWDFGSFILSGYAASRGFNPYGSELLAQFASQFRVSLTVPNLNPPLSVPVFELLSKLDPLTAFRVWWWLSLGLQVACVAWLVHRGPGRRLLRGLWGMSLGGLWMNLALGQIYAPLASLVVVAYRFLESRPVVAGVCAGLVAAWKPHFLLWPALLFVAGHKDVAWTAGLVFVVASAAPIVTHGQHIYQEWLAAVTEYQGMHVATNVSLTAWLSGFLPEGIPWVVASVAIAGCAAYLFKQRPSAPFCSDVALVMVVTLSPISWAGYTLLLLPIFLRRVWCPPLTLSAALLVFPANLLWEWSSTHPHDIFGPRMLYPLAVLFLAVDLFRHGPE